MTVEEALAIVETALDYDRLNHVQEILFRQSWAGLSYREIAKNSGYDPDYLKDAGSKLWKELSKVFGEKVKKDNLQSVLKRYLKRNQLTLQRNRLIEVNLNGTNISDTQVVGNLHESNFCQANSYKKQAGNNKTELDKTNIEAEDNSNSLTHSPSETITHGWKGWQFRSAAEANIA